MHLTTELDEILIPSVNGYKTMPMLMLTGGSQFSPGKAMGGFGQAPMHYITTRGPEQDGETPVGLRWDVRSMQLAIEYTQNNRQDYWLMRQRIIELLNPGVSFGETAVSPFKYRKIYPGGKLIRGSDAQVTNGSTTVIVPYGRFIDVGGLHSGNGIQLNGVNYKINDVPNDFTIELTAVYGGATGVVGWRYMSNQTQRELYCLPEAGPQLNYSAQEAQLKPFGFADIVRFVAHNPFWYGVEQTQSWALPEDFGDLVFDGAGAYFGAVQGDGRWLFAPSTVGGTVDVVYWGSYRARPRLVVDGPASSVSFQNQTTGKSIQIEYSVDVGESITIDTLNTSVTKNDGTNLLPFTVGDISFFAIEPENVDHGRTNTIFVSFAGADGNSRATMYWSNAYTGI